MTAIQVGKRVVTVGDRVKYIVGGKTGIRPATVVDLGDVRH